MPIIEVKDLVKRYGAQTAVDGVSFTIEQGEIFGILGPNGAGKTTTVEMIAGLRTPDSGTIRVLGLDPQRDRAQLRQVLGVQLQASELAAPIKVWGALDLYSAFYAHPADWEALLEQLGLAEERNTLFRQLSGGQKQRLSIALALVGNPTIVVLDELTTGLDPQARRDTWHLIEDVRARGVTVLLVTHFMEEAEQLCDRVALIAAGRVVALDTPAGLVALAGVTLSYMGDVVTLDVRDDGVGFAVPQGSYGPNGAEGAGPGRQGTGFGLTAMRQRVSRVAGTLVVESEPGGGTAISARVPAIGAQPPGEVGGPQVTRKEAQES